MNWMSLVAIFMIVVGAGFIYFVLRENERPLPQGGVQWAATVLSTLLIVFSGFLLALTLTPGEWTQVESIYDPRADEMDKPAPNFAFRTVADDSPQQLEQYKGNVVLLNFWATWCAPCLAEMPDLNRLYAQYKEEGLIVLTISDETPDVLQAFDQTMVPLQTPSGYLTDVASLPNPFRRTLAGRPTTYIIDREGYLRLFVKGSGDYAYFEQLVLPYLEDDLAAR